ncbi:Thiamine-phosphate synthase [Anaerohalosphaera lusitana]|uniref:Thiamine-phosphate synthase n=1 Tax=Anaerohalosphaera lusitana TaxID=1936003 RepID=A0A1U9NKU7_9BACT|nr:thiamine phosphate synthase [Anaerohalosphaera lusitana]AQT68348.1 Thiamine-phosphate synthase [Anaerohalosphaera lusitana]
MEKSAYRIIDANLNRGREAARVMEEFCRFYLNSSELSGRAKNLRHRLCGAGNQFDISMLVSARDSGADVGRGLAVSDQLKRTELRDCFTAAVKRISEALRALAEVSQTLKPELTPIFEELRFETYTLEKDAVLAASVKSKVDRIRLYVLVTAAQANTDDELLQLTEACCRGGADCLQLRAKGLSDGRTYRLAEKMVSVCSEHQVVSIINDRPDIALASGADGVHLGQDDMPVSKVRELFNRPMIVGLSTHNADQLEQAIRERPDYVGLGPVFETRTKHIEKLAGLEYVEHAVSRLHDTGIGHVAIGGINAVNADDVISAGASAVAVCSAVTGSNDPAAACDELNNILSKAGPENDQLKAWP